MVVLPPVELLPDALSVVLLLELEPLMPPVPLPVPVPPLMPVPPVVVSVVLPGVVDVVLLVLSGLVGLVEPMPVVPAAPEVELVLELSGIVVVVVSSFLPHAATDNAIATPIAIQRGFLIKRSSLLVEMCGRKT